MPDQTLKELFNNGLVFMLIAVWGGTASYIGRLKKLNRRFSIIELVGEWTISGFAGIITAYFCQELNQSFFITAALAGVAGHMGGRAIYLMEHILERKAEQMLNIKAQQEDDDHAT